MTIIALGADGTASSLWNVVPSWIQAFGSVLALVFAAAAVVFTGRMFRIESRRDQMSAEARHRQAASAEKAQAALVSAWSNSAENEPPGVFARNASEAPVYQVFLTAVNADDHSESTKAYSPVLPPSDHPIFFQVDQHVPASRATARRVKVSFTDAVGARWLRTEYGTLAKCTSNLSVMADERRTSALRQFEDDFYGTYRVNVKFRTSPRDYPEENYVSDMQGLGLDAVICPHDWIGALAVQRVIEPTVLSAEHKSAFPPWALAALTFDNCLYGLPTTIDTVALFRNTDLAPDPPTTFDELVATGQELKDAGRISEIFALRVGERGDPFQIWPLFSSAGGWLFARTRDGQWDHAQIGLGKPESIAAFEQLRELGEAGLGVLRRSMGREETFELFTSGRTPFLISTSDGLEPARNAGISVAVSAVPAFAGGKPASAFSLVHGLLMIRKDASRASRDTSNVVAHDLFADYLSHAGVMTAMAERTVGPVAKSSVANEDAAIGQLFALCESGLSMPSFPEMKRVWRVLEQAETAVIGGAPAESTALRAAAKLAEIFETREARRHGGPVVA